MGLEVFDADERHSDSTSRSQSVNTGIGIVQHPTVKSVPVLFSGPSRTRGGGGRKVYEPRANIVSNLLKMRLTIFVDNWSCAEHENSSDDFFRNAPLQGTGVRSQGGEIYWKMHGRHKICEVPRTRVGCAAAGSVAQRAAMVPIAEKNHVRRASDTPPKRRAASVGQRERPRQTQPPSGRGYHHILCVALVSVLQWGGIAMAFTITSPAFEQERTIPAKYTCDGEDVSPPLQWSDPPAGTQSLVLIVDDPDAPVGTWVHWVVYNMPPGALGVPEQASQQARLPQGAVQGITDFRSVGYGGPCPPARAIHRYFFKLYALDVPLPALPSTESVSVPGLGPQPPIRSPLTKIELLKTMQGHVLDTVTLMGTYQRSR